MSNLSDGFSHVTGAEVPAKIQKWEMWGKRPEMEFVGVENVDELTNGIEVHPCRLFPVVSEPRFVFPQVFNPYTFPIFPHFSCVLHSSVTVLTLPLSLWSTFCVVLRNFTQRVVSFGYIPLFIP